MYSLSRVSAAAKLLPSLKIIPGAALDLTVNQEDGTPWDFEIKANRDTARALHEEQQLALLVGQCAVPPARYKLSMHIDVTLR